MLFKISDNNNDKEGEKNYIRPLLQCLRENCKYIDEVLCNKQINMWRQNDTPKFESNAIMAEDHMGEIMSTTMTGIPVISTTVASGQKVDPKSSNCERSKCALCTKQHPLNVLILVLVLSVLISAIVNWT